MTDKMVLSVGLSAFLDINKNETTYFLDAEVRNFTPLKIEKGAKMKLELSNGTTLSLDAFNSSDGSIREVMNINGFVTHYYKIAPSFVITKFQIEDIAKNGVKKVMIDISPDQYIKEFKKDKVGSALADLNMSLSTALSK